MVKGQGQRMSERQWWKRKAFWTPSARSIIFTVSDLFFNVRLAVADLLLLYRIDPGRNSEAFAFVFEPGGRPQLELRSVGGNWSLDL